jgi:L-alanine-DL-glutamate epimerase-like enolase superfamily enzyme
MRITSVRSFLLSSPLPEPLRLPFWGGERTIVKRDAMLIRVETEHGLVGYGPGPASESAQQAIERVVAPFLEGKTLADPDALRILFLEGPARQHPEAIKPYCAVEIALYDALGKALGVPVSELLGGRVRDRIRVYGSAGMYQPAEGYAREAAQIAALGFPAYKMRPALGPEGDLEAVRLMRQAVGPDVELMVDAHAWWRMGDRSYSWETVERLAQQMAEYRIAWLEEPWPPEDHESYRRLKEKNYVPLASGEHEPSEDSFLDLIHNNCVHYVQMDICCQGGYPTGRTLLSEIAREGLRFAFHSWGTALELIAAAHLGICWPETVVEWLEYPCYSNGGRPGMYPFPLAEEILREPLVVEKGDLVVPSEPGLGVTVNEDVIHRYPWIPGPWTWFRLDSPPQTLYVSSDHSVKWAGKS